MRVLEISRILNPTYTGLFSFIFSCVQWTATKFSLNILPFIKVGFDTYLVNFSSSVINLTLILFRTFSMVFPKTLLFMSLKKSFSNSFLACFLFSVLKSMYFFIQGFWLNSNTLCIFVIINPASTACLRFLSCITYFSLSLRFGISLVNLPHLMLCFAAILLEYSDNISGVTTPCSGQYGYSLCKTCNSLGYFK